ncbi:hypothetical protein [Nocardioides marmoraquaticus]
MKVSVWKLLGLAGAAGVAATGVAVARDQRRRAQLTPDEVRDRLQQRLREAAPGADADAARGRPGS